MFAKKDKNNRRGSAGQQSRPVYNYYSNNRIHEDQPDRERQTSPQRQPRRRWLHHIPSTIIILAILGCVGYILSVNSNPKIVRLSGDQGIFLHSNVDYEQAAQRIIDKSWFNFNKVTINLAGISRQLKSEYPELSDVSVTVPLVNRRPVIYIASSKPTLLLMGANNSMIIDARGVAILPATEANNLSHYNLLSVKDESGLNLTTGQSVLPTTDVKFITDSFAQLNVANEEVNQFILPAKANELDVKLAGKAYFIKMDMTGDSREQVGAYVASKAKIASLNNNPKQYIDVRVAGRVYYQ